MYHMKNIKNDFIFCKNYERMISNIQQITKNNGDFVYDS